jgi:thiamine kinase-like enzyme
VPVRIDGGGRERLKYIDGDVAVPPYPAWAQTDDALASVASLMRAFHDAARAVGGASDSWSQELADPAGGTRVCHNDVCLENVVFRSGLAVALLDFDFAAPGRPVYDLAQFARMCVPIDDDVSCELFGWERADRAARTRVVADAYGLDRAGRHELVQIVSESIARGGEFVRRRVESGDSNFSAMWTRMGGQERFDRRARWWADQRDQFDAILD